MYAANPPSRPNVSVALPRLLALALGLSLALLATAWARAAGDAPLQDVAGGHDHPLVSRFAGSALVGYAEIGFDQASFPLTNEVKDDRFVKAETFEGKITRLAYFAPIGKSAIEVLRNYQEALKKAGFKPKFTCDKEACSSGSRIQQPFIGYARSMKQVTSYGGYSDMAFEVLNNGDEPHYAWGLLKTGGRDVVVSILISRMDASEGSPIKNRVSTFIEIVEPKSMETGQVTVDSGALQKGLASDGKVALYGIYFDTAKAEIKPESKPQLDEMAKLLNADKSVKVFVVGHTDNQGGVEANLALSQRRADAIAAVLASSYKIDPKRMVAKGVANFAPVASNDAQDGRSRNRRVELVKQ